MVDYFHYLKRKPPPLPIISHSPLPSPSPWQPLISFLSPPICLFWTSPLHGSEAVWYFVTGFLTFHDVFMFHPCCSSVRILLLFMADYIPHFAYPFIRR